MKGRRIIAAALLQDKALKQLHLNHSGTEKKGMLEYESKYWVNMNANTEEAIRKCPTCLYFQAL